jgi:hypothetical protein
MREFVDQCDHLSDRGFRRHEDQKLITFSWRAIRCPGVAGGISVGAGASVGINAGLGASVGSGGGINAGLAPLSVAAVASMLAWGRRLAATRVLMLAPAHRSPASGLTAGAGVGVGSGINAGLGIGIGGTSPTNPSNPSNPGLPGVVASMSKSQLMRVKKRCVDVLSSEGS